MKISFFLFTILFLLTSCGVDKLKSKNLATQTSALGQTGQACACNSSYTPVCAKDRHGVNSDFDNACLAQCFNATVVNQGHCDCASYPYMVCGSDGKDYTECDAKALEKAGTIQIVKYIPCAATGL